MGNKRIAGIVTVGILVCLMSCSEGRRTNKSAFRPIVTYENETLSVTSLDGDEHSVVIAINKKNVIQKRYKDVCELSISNILKGYGSAYDMAFMATSGMQNGVAMHVKVDDSIDTIIFATIEPLEIRERTSHISGNCAKLIPAVSDPRREVQVKKWLFRKGAKLTPCQMQNMCGIVSKILSNDTIDYVPNGTIPVIKNFVNLSYSVNSDMLADHYVLFAASSDEEIKDFVEEIVVNNYELTTKTLSDNLKCYRKMDSDGYKCIVLIGISDDWSYQIEPLGVVAIDNTPPELSVRFSHGIEHMLFDGNQRVILPESRPIIDGVARVSVTDWDGNGIECNVTFRVMFYGDAKSITVVRNKKLCYPGVHRVENKTIYLTNKTSPYIFTYELHFEGGDNIIPIVVEDYHGNKNEYRVNVSARFTRNEPDIQIDNNINIW